MVSLEGKKKNVEYLLKDAISMKNKGVSLFEIGNEIEGKIFLLKSYYLLNDALEIVAEYGLKGYLPHIIEMTSEINTYFEN